MARTHLGSLGRARDPIDAEFDYFGHTIRVHPDASDLVFADFMDQARSIAGKDLEEINLAGMDTVADLLRKQVHPDDWDTLWRVAKENRQSVVDLMQTARSIVEAVSGFPTGQPSVSSGGRKKTKRKSKGRSSKQVGTALVSSMDTYRDRQEARALEMLAKRPDLQTAVLRAREARLADEAATPG